MEEIIYSNVQSKTPAGGITIWGLRACAQAGCESGAYGDLGQFYQGASCTNPGQGVYFPCGEGVTNNNSCNHWVIDGNTCEAGYRYSDRPLGYTSQQVLEAGYCNEIEFIRSVLGYEYDGINLRLPCVQN